MGSQAQPLFGGFNVAEVNPFGHSRVAEEVNGRMLMPDNQWISPIGQRIAFPKVQAFGGAISPDGTKFATASSDHSYTLSEGLKIVDLTTDKVVQSLEAEGTGGVLYSPDGKTLWMAQRSDILRYEVGPSGTISDPETPVKIPLSSTAPSGALPEGLALSPDGSKLFVAINGNNAFGVIDTATNTLVKEVPVGNAPREVVIVGGKAFVSDEGGRRAVAGDTTNESEGTEIVSNPSTGAATTGTVSVVDLASEALSDTINVGLEPDGETLDGSTLFVTNSNSDSISIIDTATDQVEQTFNADPLPGSTVGRLRTRSQCPIPTICW